MATINLSVIIKLIVIEQQLPAVGASEVFARIM